MTASARGAHARESERAGCVGGFEHGLHTALGGVDGAFDPRQPRHVHWQWRRKFRGRQLPQKACHSPLSSRSRRVAGCVRPSRECATHEHSRVTPAGNTSCAKRCCALARGAPGMWVKPPLWSQPQRVRELSSEPSASEPPNDIRNTSETAAYASVSVFVPSTSRDVMCRAAQFVV